MVVIVTLSIVKRKTNTDLKTMPTNNFSDYLFSYQSQKDTRKTRECGNEISG